MAATWGRGSVVAARAVPALPAGRDGRDRRGDIARASIPIAPAPRPALHHGRRRRVQRARRPGRDLPGRLRAGHRRAAGAGRPHRRAAHGGRRRAPAGGAQPAAALPVVSIVRGARRRHPGGHLPAAGDRGAVDRSAGHPPVRVCRRLLGRGPGHRAGLERVDDAAGAGAHPRQLLRPAPGRRAARRAGRSRRGRPGSACGRRGSARVRHPVRGRVPGPRDVQPSSCRASRCRPDACARTRSASAT